MLTVIIATQGRPCIVDALRSIRDQAPAYQVEIIVVGDTHEPDEQALAAAHVACQEYRALYLTHNAGFHHWGHPQAQYAMPFATGERLAFLGDDDVYLPGAIDLMISTDAPLALFKADIQKLGTVVWDEPRLACGRISAQCIVVKNEPTRLGVWGTGPAREGDFQFIASSVDRHAGQIDWREQVIAECH